MVIDISKDNRRTVQASGAVRPLPKGDPPLPQLRALVSEVLVGLGEQLVADTQLVVTELVTNAYQHARAARTLVLDYDPGSTCVRVEVDDGSQQLPHRQSGVPVGIGGRGLVLVAAVSQRWGVRSDPGGDGKTVWADLGETRMIN